MLVAQCLQNSTAWKILCLLYSVCRIVPTRYVLCFSYIMQCVLNRATYQFELLRLMHSAHACWIVTPISYCIFLYSACRLVMLNRYCVFWNSSDCRKVLAFWNYACSDHDNTIRCYNTEANFCCKDVFLERGTTFIWFLGSFKIHIAGHTKQVTWPKWRRALDVVRQYLRTHFASIFRKLINQNGWNFFCRII